MKRTAKRSSSSGKIESGQLLRPSGEAELSAAEEEMIETLLAQPPAKRRKGSGKSAAKRPVKARSSKGAAAATPSRTSVAKKRNSRKAPRRK